ncbi:hypothetical protein STENM223S_02088 [Streptomyces tendae]
MAVLREENDLPDGERCRAWLDVASAVDLAGTGGDGDRSLLFHALAQAEEVAGDDEDLRVECRSRAANAHWESYERTGDPASVDLAVDTVGGGTAPAARGRPTAARRADRLRHRSARAGRPPRHAAGRPPGPVDLLRRAVEGTLPDDRELPHRRYQLADAHVARYEAAHVLSDLYEADWLLGEAVRDSEEPQFQALFLLHRGIVAELLHARFGTVDHAEKAVEHYTRSGEHAREEGPAGRRP